MKVALKRLAYPVPIIRDIPHNAPTLDGKTYFIADNPHQLQSIGFKQEETRQFHLWLQYANRPKSGLGFDFREQVYGWDVFVKDIQFHKQKYISFAVWENDHTLALTIFYIETPYEVQYKLVFSDKEITVAFHMNVSLDLKDFECRGHLTV
jgi:hypothetical protein